MMRQANHVLKHILVDFITRSKLLTDPRELDNLLNESVRKLIQAMRVQDHLLTEKEVSERWPFLDRVRLRNYRYKGIGPVYLKLGKHRNSRVYYKFADVEAWIVEQYQLGPFIEKALQIT